MRNMHIAAYTFRTFPLVYIQPRCRGKQKLRLKKIQLCERLVALTDKFSVNMRILTAQSRIIRRRCHVSDVHASLIEFTAKRPEDIPVALVICEYNERKLLGILLHFLAAAQNKAQLHQPGLKQVIQGADDANQNSEQHTARTRVNVELHTFLLLFFLYLSFCYFFLSVTSLSSAFSVSGFRIPALLLSSDAQTITQMTADARYSSAFFPVRSFRPVGNKSSAGTAVRLISACTAVPGIRLPLCWRIRSNIMRSAAAQRACTST